MLVYFRYTIWDHGGEGVYVVNMDLFVCLEDGGDCLINVNILNQTKLFKPTCHWDTGFLNSGIFGRIIPLLLNTSTSYTLHDSCADIICIVFLLQNLL